MGSFDLVSTIDGTKGYSTDIQLSNSDLVLVRKMIRMQWLYRLQLLSPQCTKEFDHFGMENYHLMSNVIEHAVAWPKTTRILPREAVSIIREMDFFKQLEKHLGKFHISDEEHLGWENIYWRLVRPGSSDIGSLHADKWFWDIGSYGEVAQFPHRRLKIWIAIYTEPGKNGLFVLPGSHHKKDWNWHAETRYGLSKPVFDESVENLDLLLLPLKAGETVVFHDELLHGGASNAGKASRVSVEFTLLVPV